VLTRSIVPWDVRLGSGSRVQVLCVCACDAPWRASRAWNGEVRPGCVCMPVDCGVDMARVR
jgi:hypothetical protein